MIEIFLSQENNPFFCHSIVKTVKKKKKKESGNFRIEISICLCYFIKNLRIFLYMSMANIQYKGSVEQIWTKIRNPDYDYLRAKYPQIIGKYFTNDSESTFTANSPLNKPTDGINITQYQGKEISQKGSLFVFTKESNYVLTELLAKEYFGVTLILDREYLCPRLGNRMAYITWIHTLLEQPDIQLESQEIRGLDIGTGASCVYPLIAAALYKDWNLLGTDLSKESFEHAQAQLARNPALAERIEVKLCKPESNNFFFFAKSTADSNKGNNRWANLDFVVCNPPFYKSAIELANARENKQGEASTELQAQDHELYTNGGEYDFVKVLIDQSLLQHKQQSQQHHPRRGCWYTAMINKKSNLLELIKYIKQQQQGAHTANYVVHDLDTGSRTLRWTLGWNWEWYRAPHAASHSVTLKNVNSDPVQLIVPLVLPVTSFVAATGANTDENTPSLIHNLAAKLKKELEQLDYISLKQLPASRSTKSVETKFDVGKTWLLTVKGDVWSRAYRRRQLKRQKIDENSKENSIDVSETILKIALLESGERGANVRLQIDWIYGCEYKTFESFTTMMKRRLETA